MYLIINKITRSWLCKTGNSLETTAPRECTDCMFKPKVHEALYPTLQLVPRTKNHTLSACATGSQKVSPKSLVQVALSLYTEVGLASGFNYCHKLSNFMGTVHRTGQLLDVPICVANNCESGCEQTGLCCTALDGNRLQIGKFTTGRDVLNWWDDPLRRRFGVTRYGRYSKELRYHLWWTKTGGSGLKWVVSVVLCLNLWRV